MHGILLALQKKNRNNHELFITLVIIIEIKALVKLMIFIINQSVIFLIFFLAVSFIINWRYCSKLMNFSQSLLRWISLVHSTGVVLPFFSCFVLVVNCDGWWLSIFSVFFCSGLRNEDYNENGSNLVNLQNNLYGLFTWESIFIVIVFCIVMKKRIES